MNLINKVFKKLLILKNFHYKKYKKYLMYIQKLFEI